MNIADDLIAFIEACLDDEHGISEVAYDRLVDLERSLGDDRLKKIIDRSDGTNGRFYL